MLDGTVLFTVFLYDYLSFCKTYSVLKDTQSDYEWVRVHISKYML